MPRGNKPAGYVGLLLAKHHLGRNEEDYTNARPKKMARNFNIRKMRTQQNPKRPSDYIEAAYGQQRAATVPLSAAQRRALREDAEAGDERAINQLARIRQAETERQRASRARRRGGAMVGGKCDDEDCSCSECEDSESDEEMKGAAYHAGFMKGLEFVARNMLKKK